MAGKCELISDLDNEAGKTEIDLSSSMFLTRRTLDVFRIRESFRSHRALLIFCHHRSLSANSKVLLLVEEFSSIFPGDF